MKTIKVLCADCKKTTNHNVLAEHKTVSNPEEEIRWWANYQIIRCNGVRLYFLPEDIGLRRGL